MSRITSVLPKDDYKLEISGYAEKAAQYSLPKVNAAVDFADNGKIAEYAKAPVSSMQQAAIISGKGNNAFDPQANATRAEAAHSLCCEIA